MTYKISITKLVDNPDYEAQMKAYDRERMAQYNSTALQFPTRQIELMALSVELPEEVFAAIRKACIEAL